MIKREDVFRIGRLGKPHGVKGEILFNFTDDVFDRVEAEYLFIDIEGLLVPFFLEEYSFYGDDMAVIKFSKIDSSEAAREFTGNDVYFPKALNDGKNETDELKDICGYKLIDANNGKQIGLITSIDDSTMNVLFNVKTIDGHEILIPASDDLITDIDHLEHSITMKVPDGIMDL